ncbi:hypothetical protein MKI84_09535 [Ancylobacter sp. A5.8]|uniref:hypothetical protein n=1 Tax=Ancylobacter gelatini TaxID=2919920 RepID=UPI001F4DCDC3|nr:hypothetical protein [Ancylobacter gelatini]MCJ8143160.1 hypothetical protein [Ancylobacter gelatini]
MTEASSPAPLRPLLLGVIESASRIGAVACLIALPLLSLLPAGSIERTGVGKDLEHFAAYAGTGVLLTLGIGSRQLRIVASILLMVLAAGLEVAQSYTATRSAELEQFASGVLGAGAGLIVGSLGRRLLAGRRLWGGFSR